MRLITLDAGNTSLDIVFWRHKIPERHIKLSYEELKSLKKLPLRGVGISVKPSVNEKLKEIFPRVKLLKKEEIPIEVHYETYKTLGIDRIALAYAVREFYSKNSVIVSCGTALFVDLLLEGKFQGGLITLGIGKKLSCLLSLTEGIKKLRLEKLAVEVGKSTRECVVGGIIKESEEFIKGTIESWKRAFKKDFKVVITGGEGYLLKHLGIWDPLVLHKGLRKLFDFYR